jgi:Leucine-rich repeat (LRR) protein
MIGGGLGWLVRSAQIQRDAVAAIVTAGGSVKYDWEWNNGDDIRDGKPWAPRWLVDLIGVDYFGHVTSVQRFTSGMHGGAQVGRKADESTVAAVARLTGLQELDLSGHADDAGMVHLKGLTQLTRLFLHGSQVSDAGLEHLAGLTKISDLGLGATQVTDAGLTNFKGLTKLDIVDLRDTQVSDPGLMHLGALASLSGLDLRRTKVTDAGLTHLKSLMKLRFLVLEDTRVTDAAIESLKRESPKLEVLR